MGHLLHHGPVDIFYSLELAGGHPIGDPGKTHQKEQDGDQPLQQQGTHQGMAVLGQDAGEKANGDDGNVHQAHPAGPAEPLCFRFRQVLDRFQFFGFILPEPGFDKMLGGVPQHQGHQEGGSHHKVPVAGDVHGVDPFAQESVQGLVGKPLHQGISAGDHQVGGKAGVGSGVSYDHPHQRVLPHPDVHQGRQRGNHHGSRIRGNVPHGAHKGDQVGHHSRGHVLHAPPEQAYQQAAFLTETDGQGHGDHKAQRGEPGEVLHHVAQKPVDPLFGKQILGHDRLAVGRVHQAHSGSRKSRSGQSCNDKQNAEQNGRRGQFVTDLLHSVQKPVHPAAPGLLRFFLHLIPSFSCNCVKRTRRGCTPGSPPIHHLS